MQLEILLPTGSLFFSKADLSRLYLQAKQKDEALYKNLQVKKIKIPHNPNIFPEKPF